MAPHTIGTSSQASEIGPDYSDWSRGPAHRSSVAIAENVPVGQDFSGFSHGPTHRRPVGRPSAEETTRTERRTRNYTSSAVAARRRFADYVDRDEIHSQKKLATKCDTTIAIVMTCFNRAAITSRCIESIKRCAVPAGVKVNLYLTDDGCTDGTSEIVKSLSPSAVITEGDGSLFWCGGMRASMQRALNDNADYVLWLNDDVVLYPTAISEAWNTLCAGSKKCIVIGSTVDTVTTAVTYGGLVAKKSIGSSICNVIDPRIESQYHTVDPEIAPGCETMCGNFVLIPRAVALEVGPIDSEFTHWLGDVDYGYRARAKGVELRLIRKIIGTCASNSRQEMWREPEPTFLEYFHKVHSTKGLASKERAHYYRRHGGAAWWLAWALPYVSQLVLYPFLARKAKKSVQQRVVS